MFAEPGPRLLGLPCGVDFAAELVDGLIARLAGAPAEAMARVTLYLNSQRMSRRVVAAFGARGPGLLPRLRLVTDLARDMAFADLPAPVSPLRRRLELSRVVDALLTAEPKLAPRSALFDLAGSLADLMDEMQGEGVHPGRIAGLDVSDHSEHWQRTQTFMGALAPYFADTSEPDRQTRQRLVMERIEVLWRDTPPGGPVLVAGSTGSRGITARLMRAVMALPQGAVVLPGFDFDLPARMWDGLEDALTAEDHPQFRFHRLLREVGASPGDVARWTDAAPPAPGRNALISLSLRPAPVTDQWRTEGQALPPLPAATADMTLLEAPDPRAEASAIALILRDAAERGERAALVSPDRNLTRRVTAALDRWQILPDDSAGRPLALSAPGRLLRHVAERFGERLTAEALLELLKHPLTASGPMRGAHLLLTRRLELSLRRRGPAYPTGADLASWAEGERQEGAARWAAWLGAALDGLEALGDRTLGAHVADHMALTEMLAAGPDASGSGQLWDEAAGMKALGAMQALAAEAGHGGTMGTADYRALLRSVLGAEDVREAAEPHPGILILGPREVREHDATLLILGGLTDGSWPQIPPPDPWMNRKMRLDAGLLLPERRIGLSAHDYQQAVAAPRVVLSCALRSADAETVPSRWLNRLSNLMGGLPDREGPEALAAMRARGAAWLALSAAAEAPVRAVPSAHRPAPRPPVEVRPKVLPVTAIAKLIRDPYHVYARHVLRLRPLDSLHAAPDARLRGSVLHRIMERFAKGWTAAEPRPAARDRLMRTAHDVLEEEVPWPAARLFWLARVERAADHVPGVDAALGGRPVVVETEGALALPAFDFTLTARPDRIDLLPDGRVHVFDYKSGKPPTRSEQEHFEKQLLLEAAMVLHGGFEALGGPREVAGVTYVGLGANLGAQTETPDRERLDTAWEDLGRLVARYGLRAQGYASRRAMHDLTPIGDYDHLARFGEWEMTAAPVPEDVG